MQEKYSNWNTKLFHNFFQESESGKLVFCYVDDNLLEELGGVNDFLLSVVTSLGYSASITEIMETFKNNPLSINFSAIDPPEYFGIICFTIYTWTIDPNLKAGNFYERFKMSLLNGYQLAGLSIQAAEELNNKWSQSEISKCRALFERLYSNLDKYLNKALRGKIGFFAYKPRESDYVGLPRYHALINSIEKLHIEEALAEFNYHKENVMPPVEICNFIDNYKYKIFRPSSLTKWNNPESAEFQNLLVAIVSSIMSTWDDSNNQFPTELIQKTLKQKGISNTRLGFSFIPFIEKDTFNDQAKLFLMVQSESPQFPNIMLKIEALNRTYLVTKGALNFSRKIDLHVDVWHQLFNSSSSFPFTVEDTYKQYTNLNTLIFFNFSVDVNGYIPTKQVSEGEKYFIFANQTDNTEFFANNPKLQLIQYSPIIEGFYLYRTPDLGLESVIGFKQNNSIEKRTSLSLVNGFRCNQKPGLAYFLEAPPQILVDNDSPCILIISTGSQRIELPNVVHNELVSIPPSILESGEFLISLQFQNHYEQNYLNFSLVPSIISQQTLKECDSLKDSLVSKQFLYDLKDFEITIHTTGAGTSEKLRFFKPKSDDYLYICHTMLDNLSIYYDSLLQTEFLSSEFGLSKTKLYPNPDCGSHEISVYWHGLLVRNITFYVLELPDIDIRFSDQSCIPLKLKTNKILVYRDFNPTCEISISSNEHLPLVLIVNGITKHINSSHFSHSLSLLELNKLSITLVCNQTQLWCSEYTIIKLPSITVGIDKTSGNMWKGSPFFSPAASPTFDMVYDSIDSEMIELFEPYLGDEPYSSSVQEPGYNKYFPKLDKLYIGNNQYFNFRIDGNQIFSYSDAPLSLIRKPILEILLKGKQDENGTYLIDPSLRIILKPELKNIRLISDTFELKKYNDNEYYFKTIKLNHSQKYINVKFNAFWFEECIAEKLVTLGNFSRCEITLYEGTPIFKNLKNVYIKNHAPKGFMVESDEIESTKFRIVINKKIARDAELTYNVLIPFNDLKFNEDDDVIVEVYNGEIKHTSKRFIIVGKNLLYIGREPQMVALVNEDISWQPCWILEKRGKNNPKVYQIQDNLDMNNNVTLDKKSYGSYFSNRKSVAKFWNDLMYMKIEFQCKTDQVEWKKFLDGILS